MRISDWSSDVCSSDLQRLRVDVTRVDERHHAEIAETHARLQRKFREAAAADRIIIQIARADVLIAVSAHRPIGSASCRERVCKYAYIPGVVGRSKKNTQLESIYERYVSNILYV